MCFGRIWYRWAECSEKVASERRVAGAIRFLVNGMDLKLECVRVLHETLLIPVLMYGSETMLWKEKERCRIRAVLCSRFVSTVVFHLRISK